MTEDYPPRRYDDDEVARILKRATEIRSDSKALVRREAEGLTLADLEDIAAEAGIDVGHVRLAAMELESTPLTRAEGVAEELVGGPLTLVLEETLEGELDEEGFEVLAEAVQRLMKEGGFPSFMSRTFSWRNETAKSGGRATTLSVSSRNGGTTLRIEENLQQVAGGFQGGITVGAGVGVGVGAGVPLSIYLGSVALGVAFPLGAVALAYMGARAAYRAYVAHRRRVMRSTLTHLLEICKEELERVARAPGSPPEPAV